MTGTKAFDGRVILGALSGPASDTGEVPIRRPSEHPSPEIAATNLVPGVGDSTEWSPVSDQYSDDSRRSDGPGPLNAGDRFLKYHIVREIGAGGYARVYQAFDTFVKREVALKVIHRPSGDQKELLLRTSAEARFLVNVSHPYLVKVLDAGYDHNNVLYVAMELLRGKPLRALIQSFGRLEWEQFIPIAAMIAEGLQVVHENKAVHRDLKPENIFVLKDGTPKILDFGIAKFIDSPAVITQKNIFHGTPSYMAPEQLLGKPASSLSDMYALGVVFWEVLAGRNPFQLEPCNTLEDLAWRHLHFQPPLLSDFTETVPRRVAKVINKMMAKPPSQRPQSMKELAVDLRRAYEKCMSASPQQFPTHSTGGIVALSANIIAEICGEVPPRQAAPVEVHQHQPNAPTQPRLSPRAPVTSVPRPVRQASKPTWSRLRSRDFLHPRTWPGMIVISVLAGLTAFGLVVVGYKTGLVVAKHLKRSSKQDQIVIDISDVAPAPAVAPRQATVLARPPAAEAPSLDALTIPSTSAPTAAPPKTAASDRSVTAILPPPNAPTIPSISTPITAPSHAPPKVTAAPTTAKPATTKSTTTKSATRPKKKFPLGVDTETPFILD